MSVNLNELREIAEAFRKSIGRTSDSRDCGVTSELLARYLRDAYRIDAQFIRANCGERQTHAWVITEGIIIDITADHFEQERVIVKTESAWHDAWTTTLPSLT